MTGRRQLEKLQVSLRILLISFVCSVTALAKDQASTVPSVNGQPSARSASTPAPDPAVRAAANSQAKPDASPAPGQTAGSAANSAASPPKSAVSSVLSAAAGSSATSAAKPATGSAAKSSATALTAKDIEDLTNRAYKLTDMPASKDAKSLAEHGPGMPQGAGMAPDWQRQEDFLQWFFVGAALLGFLIAYVVWRTTPSAIVSPPKPDGENAGAAATGDDLSAQQQ